MFKEVIEQLVSPTITVSQHDAEVVRKIIAESGIQLELLSASFRKLSKYSYTDTPMQYNQLTDIIAGDTNRVLDKKDVGAVTYIFDELQHQLLKYRDEIIPKEWYMNISMIIGRMMSDA